MLLVLVYFLLVFAVVHPLGLGFNYFVVKRKVTFIETVLLGLFVITVVSSFWIFFLPLNLWWSIVIASCSLLAAYFFRYEILEQIKSAKNEFLRISILKKLFYLLVTLMILYSSALPAYAIDNDSYYIQTIKWLDQYGLVKGLSSVHFFLTQQSGFHILEAALNFNLLYDRWNDLGSFYFLLGLLWSLQSISQESKFLKYYRSGFSVLSIISFTFISAPSPDVPVYVMSYMMIYYFLKLWDSYNEKLLLFAAVICIQMVFFKVTVALAFLLIILLIVKHRTSRRVITQILSFGFLVAGVFISKNMVVSGLPLYPLTTWSPVELPWQLPDTIAQLYKTATTAQAYGVNFTKLQNLSTYELFEHWFFHVGLEGLVNKAVLLSIIVAFLFVFFKKDRSSIKWVIAVFLLQSFILAITSPQFRFFINLLVPVSILILLSIWLSKIRVWKTISISFITIGFMITAMVPLKNALTDNQLMKSNRNFQFTNLIQPYPNSIYSKEFELVKEDQFYYHSATNEDFFYGTYDLPVPAVKKEYVNYIKTYFYYKPVLIDSTLSGGFKYVKIETNPTHKFPMLDSLYD